MPNKYTLTLNQAQAEILCRALDLYARIGIGQWNKLAWARKPEGDITIDFDEPHQTGKEPLAPVSTVTDT